MLYATVLRPPAFGQILVSYDDSGARSLPGVIDVITIGKKVRDYQESGKWNWSMKMSNSDKVVVIAKTTWDAMKGKSAIRATWKTETPLESSGNHDSILLDLLNGNEFNTMRKDGNVKEAFTSADKVMERVYESPFLPHNTLEPMNFFANVTPDKVHLVGPVQTPQAAAEVVSDLLGRDI